MSFLPDCPLCGSDHSKPFDQRLFRGKQVTNQVCSDCGMVYQKPRMTDEELTQYYQSDYRIQYQAGEGPSQKDLRTQLGRAQSLTRFVMSQVRSVTRHLDIGCSAGLLLKNIHEAYHCQSIGIEPGNAYRKYARDIGFTVYPSLETAEEAEKSRFDLISMAHVLEHLPQPTDYLRHLRSELLGENGCLLIEVPNLYAHDSFETAHTVAYSRHTLLQTLHKAGFVEKNLEVHGRPRSTVIPLYLTVLASPAQDGKKIEFHLQPELQVRLKRKVGMLRRKILTRLVPRKAWLQLMDNDHYTD